jgi:ABC-type phosphate transport system substrate-binding protein
MADILCSFRARIRREHEPCFSKGTLITVLSSISWGRALMHQSSNRYSSLCLRAARLTLGCLVATIFFSAAWAGAADAPIVIRGSKNLQPVVVQWADSFAQTAKAPPLDIVATGTSQGIEDLLAGHADIAMASRPISQDEVAAAADKGLSVRETIVARMGIAVIVNHDNPVSSVSVGRLAEIFSGDVQNWQTVGGPDEPITVVRKTSGWSPDFFHHTIMGDKEFTADSVIVDSK